MNDKRKRINPKLRKLEDVKQKLYQAQADGDKFGIKVWTDILRKLTNEKK